MVFNGDNNRVEVDGGGDNCDNRVEMMLLLWRRCCAEVISVGCHLTVATVATVATVVVCQPIIVLKTVTTIEMRLTVTTVSPSTELRC